MSGDERAYFFYLLILLLFIGGGFIFSRGERLSTNLRNAAIWVLIFLGAVIVYGFSDTLQQQLLPNRAISTSDGYEIGRGSDGHFHLTLDVNGANIDFIIDTGASQIVLSQDDARKAGIDPDKLAFLGRASTANGEVRTASVILDHVTLGDLRIENVRASVNGGQMFGSLLGIEYLNRFAEISIQRDRLILRP